MKGCLLVLGLFVVGVVLTVGVAITVERIGSSKNEPLTGATTQVEYTVYEPETHSGNGRTSSTIEGANVEYQYKAEGRWFKSSGPIWRPLSRLSDKVVCFDPDDPALHTIRGNPEATCGEGNLGGVRRAKEMTP